MCANWCCVLLFLRCFLSRGLAAWVWVRHHWLSCSWCFRHTACGFECTVSLVFSPGAGSVIPYCLWCSSKGFFWLVVCMLGATILTSLLTCCVWMSAPLLCCFCLLLAAGMLIAFAASDAVVLLPTWWLLCVCLLCALIINRCCCLVVCVSAKSYTVGVLLAAPDCSFFKAAERSSLKGSTSPSDSATDVCYMAWLAHTCVSLSWFPSGRWPQSVSLLSRHLSPEGRCVT